MRTKSALGRWPDVRPPRFRRGPFRRDMVSDPGRADPPRMAVQPVLPSTVLNGSASAMTSLSGLNTYPIKITVYASRAPSLTPPQHSLSRGLLALSPLFGDGLKDQ